ncbi:hypothetical protein Tco_1176107 [Tanacetum coccineum]
MSNFKPESYMLSLDSGDKIKVTHSKIHKILGVPVGGYSLFDLDEREADHEFVRLWVGQFFPKPLKDIRVNDIASKLVVAQEVDFLFKVNFLTLSTNTMGKADGLKGQICLDVVRRLSEDCVICDIDWCGYIYDCLQSSKLPKGTNHYLSLLTFLILLYLDSTKCDRFPVACTRPTIRNWSSYLMKQRQEVFLEDLMRKASSDYPGDGKFVELQEKYVQVFRDPISFDVDVNSVDGGNDSDGDDDNDDGNENTDEELNDEKTLGRNPSFGFSKIRLDDFDKQPSGSGKSPNSQVIEKESVDPTEEGTVVEGNPAEECEIMSTAAQWLERNADLVGEIIDSITG